MNGSTRRQSAARVAGDGATYNAMLAGITSLLEKARRHAARSVNSVMTMTYWEIGRRIVEYEQAGRSRADYGRELVKRLGEDLSKLFGRGFGWRNLFQMRAFYLTFPPILQTMSAKSGAGGMGAIVHKISASSRQHFSGTASGILPAPLESRSFPLPWSHYVRLISLKNPDARNFYQVEALRGGWSVRQLERQIDTQFYERTALSRNKAMILGKGTRPLPEDSISPEEEIKDPLMLEFLDLKDEYSENDLECALIDRLSSFLLELGGDFAFVGRQRRLRIGDEWYRVDLLFFHRRLRCLVIIDLKLGKFTHSDAGQMHLYLNYAREHWTRPGENPPVGLILCNHKDLVLAHYTLDNLPNKVMAAEYRTALPCEKELAAQINMARRRLALRAVPDPRRSGKAMRRRHCSDG